MFKHTKEYSKINKELGLIKILDKWAKFECFIDSVVTFGFKDGDTYHQFNFICDDGFSIEMQIKDLINLKRITYFEHAVIICDEVEAGVRWSMYDTNGMN